MIAMAAHSFRMSGSSRLADSPDPSAAHSLPGSRFGGLVARGLTRGTSRIPFADVRQALRRRRRPAPSPGTTPLRSDRPGGRRRGGGAGRHANRPGSRVIRSVGRRPGLRSATGSTGPLLSSSASGVRFLKWKLCRIHLSNQFFHFLARLERHHVLRRDVDLVAGPRVAGLAGARFLTSKTPKFRSSIRPSETSVWMIASRVRWTMSFVLS